MQSTAAGRRASVRGVGGAAKGGVVVEWFAHCLVVRAAGAAATDWLPAIVPAESGRTAVVVDRSAVAALFGLDRGLLAQLGRQLETRPAGSAGGLRLLVGRSATPGPDATPPLAARLAGALGVEVVAPDGQLVVLGRGELFSAGATGAWCGFAPGGRVERSGSRFPSPAWQADLPLDFAPRASSAQVTVTPVPAGLWVRAAGRQAAELSDPGFAVAPAPERLALLVGRPGEVGRPSEVPPPVTGLAEVVRALPAALREGYVVVPYGAQPGNSEPIAQQLARRLGADVLATHIVPWYAEDGSVDPVAVDEAGRPTWRPFVSESVYHPGQQAPTPRAWWPPLPDLTVAGPASFWLDAGWVVEVVPSGLLVRPATLAAEPAVLRRPVDPHHVDIVVTAAFRAPDNVPVLVLGAVGWLARRLPEPVQDRLRLVITDRVDPPELIGLASALRLPLDRLTPDAPPATDDPAAGSLPAGSLPAGSLPAGGPPAAAVPTGMATPALPPLSHA